jgi:hypothetical protein
VPLYGRVMTKAAKWLLTLTIICFISGGAFNSGLVSTYNIDALYALLPLGAVFLGLFLIVLILGKESLVHKEDPHLSEPSSQGPAEHAPPAVEDAPEKP